MLVSSVPALRDYWYAVAYSQAVGDRPVAARLFGEAYVVWRAARSTPRPARARTGGRPWRRGG